MKYVLVIGDGIADEPVEQLGGVTPLTYVDCPHKNILAGSQIGVARTVPVGVVPGSDTAILSIFGFDPRTCFTGRSALEAAGSGVTVKPGEVSLRVNLCALEGDDFDTTRILSHNGGNIHGQEALQLMNDLLADEGFKRAAEVIDMHIAVSDTFRHIGILGVGHQPPSMQAFLFTEPHNVLGDEVLPHLPKGYLGEEISALMRASFAALRDHPVNKARIARGLLPANCVWPWGPGAAMELAPFEEKFGRTAAVVSAVPLVWGIAGLAGIDAPRVPDATGEIDTNYEGKVEAALDALRQGKDFVAIHVEAPDECAHAGDIEGKCEAIARLDARVIAPLLKKLPEIDSDFRMLYMSDHPTLLATRGHDANPVPFAIYDSRRPGTPLKFDEIHARASGLNLDCASESLMPLLFELGN